MVIVEKISKSAGGVVLNSRNEVLVVSQNGDSWSLPKGHIDEGETALVAAKREILEETGISKLEFIGELGTYKRYRIGINGQGEDSSELKQITVFLFKTKQQNLKPLDKDNPEALWIDKEKVAEFLTHPKDKEFFLRIKGKI